MKTIDEILKTPNLKVIQKDDEGGFMGWWIDPLTQKRWFFVFSSAEDWEHLSVSGKRVPDWEMMCKFKSMFWNEDEICIEYHPAKKDYVNQMSNCLHIWKPTKENLPIPPYIFVGLSGDRGRDERELQKFDHFVKEQQK